MILYYLQKKWQYLAPLITRLPNWVLEFGAKIFIKFQKPSTLGQDLPERLVLFATKKCNLRCQHCFYIPHASPAPEITLEQIKKIAASASGRLKQVVFTGGECFLRDDFFDIVAAFAKNGCQTANIITNGTLPEKVRLFLDKILAETKVQLVFMLSLDGPPELNDQIRGVPGAAQKTFATLTLLSEYYQKYPERFGNIFISTTISRLNFARLPEIINLTKPLKNIKHSFSFARSADLNTFGAAKDSLSGFDVDKNIVLDTNEMRKVFDYLNREFWKHDKSLFASSNRQVMAETIKIIEKMPTHFSCLAGKTEIVVYPEGDVAICEMLKPVGNLKETDYDLTKFYRQHQKKFQASRTCQCTHDCALLSSIRFSPASLVEMVKRNKV